MTKMTRHHKTGFPIRKSPLPHQEKNGRQRRIVVHMAPRKERKGRGEQRGEKKVKSRRREKRYRSFGSSTIP